LALESAARDEEEGGLKHQALLSEAAKLFEDGIQRDRADPFGYIGKLNIIKQKVDRSQVREERDEHVLSALGLLEETNEATHESPIIAAELAKVKANLAPSTMHSI
jgi:hypothetical protein